MDEFDSGGGGHGGGFESVLTVLKQIMIGVNGLNSSIKSVFPQMTGTTITATTGVNGAPPAQVVGYITVTLPSGASAKIPYYNV